MGGAQAFTRERINMYTGSEDVKQKRRARRPEGEEWSEAVIRNLRQQVKYALRFFVVETALH